eukprot:TRINITY_DN1118_c0_g1_i2.p1 TRINITY_DN1118_c0_g1~~TRINITY_DN1118_c0_g1_i2.p1  ORF type:complete len:252 (-),score=37.76 TRINITY_DN1118_c0_g1_i2:28-783(-)
MNETTYHFGQDDRKVEVSRVTNLRSFNFHEYDSILPPLADGRIHHIQFSNAIARINVVARTHRDKRLFLKIMFTIGCVIIIIYPFIDTTYYLPILIFFGFIVLLEYSLISYYKAKTAEYLAEIVERENQLFMPQGLKLTLDGRTSELTLNIIHRIHPPRATNNNNNNAGHSDPKFHRRLENMTGNQKRSFQELHNEFEQEVNSSAASTVTEISPPATVIIPIHQSTNGETKSIYGISEVPIIRNRDGSELV